MSSHDSVTSNYYPRKIFKLRKKNAQKSLTNNISLLGYILIIYQYIKFTPSSWFVFFRLMVQTVIASPFPADSALIRVIQRVRRNNETTANDSADLPSVGERLQASPTLTTNSPIPGAYPQGVTASEINDEDIFDLDQEVIDFKKRLRASLFHAIILIDIGILLYRLFNPIDFNAMINGKRLSEKGLNNIPSMFLNGDGIYQGELRGGMTLQLIGERLPANNFIANLQMWLLDFFILLLQLTLLTLTGVNFSKLGYKEPKHIRYGKSDGYDGFLVVTEINYVDALEEFLS